MHIDPDSEGRDIVSNDGSPVIYIQAETLTSINASTPYPHIPHPAIVSPSINMLLSHCVVSRG
ncbi:hypothetical protein SC171_15570 [Pantoea cypripedii]|uniref:hypothetical protein n=1 Tax=Pantoea cypripedii TaxID=55209 RepID=UPI002FCB3CF0